MTIMNLERMKQVKDFSSMPITPTDIDGYIDYRGRYHILFELKHRNAPVKQGQRLAMDRLCNDLNKVRPTIYIIAEHNQDNPSDLINVGSCVVREFKYKGDWQVPKNRIFLSAMVKDFINVNEFERKDFQDEGEFV